MSRGKFIVIEGGDGSGKSSAIRWLKEELHAYNTLFTREPGGTEAAEEIRDTIVRNREEDLDVLTQILLFEAGRREHVMKKIIPALEAGTHVISDRFSASTYAYQIVAGNGQQYKELFEMLDALARNNLEPDLTVYLNVDPKAGLERKHSSGEELNVFDHKELSFYVQVRDAIKKYIENLPHEVIDANQPREKVREDIKHVILNAIK